MQLSASSVVVTLLFACSHPLTTAPSASSGPEELAAASVIVPFEAVVAGDIEDIAVVGRLHVVVNPIGDGTLSVHTNVLNATGVGISSLSSYQMVGADHATADIDFLINLVMHMQAVDAQQDLRRMQAKLAYSLQLAADGKLIVSVEPTPPCPLC